MATLPSAARDEFGSDIRAATEEVLGGVVGQRSDTDRRMTKFSTVAILWPRYCRQGPRLFWIMGRCCLLETIYWLLRGNFRKAFRRMRSSEVQGITATVAKKKHTVYFHSMATVEAAFSSTLAFRRVQRRAIGLLLPPSLWSKSASRKVPPAILSVLYSIDMLLGRIWSFIYMGDHYLIEFERALVPAETGSDARS